MKSYLISCAFIGALILSSGCQRSGAATDQNSMGKLLIAQASDLKQTVVVATPDALIEPGTNVLWCGTFQLAWNEGCKLIGEDIRLTHEPAMVTELNRKTFTSADIDAASYVALAGFVKDGIQKKIHDALIAKFGISATPFPILDKSSDPIADDIVAYAYMFKHLEFAEPFEQFDDGLKFAGVKVPAFGMAGEKPAHEKMASQVIILALKNSNDFVIELKTKSPRDRLILAKIAPGKTLNETIRMVDDRIGSGHPEKCSPEDRLGVPKFNFDITRTYSEIAGAELVVRNPRVERGTYVSSAEQTIKFQMDEKGVVLKSQADVVMGLGIQRQLIFDKPFLVMLKRTNAKVPYFVMWVDNPELLVQR